MGFFFFFEEFINLKLCCLDCEGVSNQWDWGLWKLGSHSKDYNPQPTISISDAFFFNI